MSEDPDREAVAELRKIKRGVYALLVFVIIGAVPAFYAGFSRTLSQRVPSWDGVTAAMRRQDFPRALSIARVLVAQQPDYYYGHAYLGAIYMAEGDVTNAEAEYLRAYELFPNEESEKDLAAARKRLPKRHPMTLLSK